MAGRYILKMNWKHDIYFIAELGQNHQGSLEIAKKMVDSLVGTPVSAIKTAKWGLESRAEEWKKMPYLGPHSFGENYYEHRKRLELLPEEFADLAEYISDNGFDFLPSFTDSVSLDFLCSLGCNKLKIASQRVDDLVLLKKAADYLEAVEGVVVMSTGMSDVEDVDKMVSEFRNVKSYLLQCTSVYPCPEEFVNLRVLRHYKTKYIKNGWVNGIGLSGHHSGIAPDIAACRMGASIIERHYTLDKGMKGSDHGASLELDQVRQFFKMMDSINVSLGSGTKRVLEEEVPAIKKLRGDL
jgi:sialic acid synthase SpsE